MNWIAPQTRVGCPTVFVSISCDVKVRTLARIYYNTKDLNNIGFRETSFSRQKKKCDMGSRDHANYAQGVGWFPVTGLKALKRLPVMFE